MKREPMLLLPVSLPATFDGKFPPPPNAFWDLNGFALISVTTNYVEFHGGKNRNSMWSLYNVITMFNQHVVRGWVLGVKRVKRSTTKLQSWKNGNIWHQWFSVANGITKTARHLGKYILAHYVCTQHAHTWIEVQNLDTYPQALAALLI